MAASAILSFFVPITLYQENTMKTLKCDLCEHEAQGETFAQWMEALKPHYGEAHADVMKDSSKTKEDMENWMAENRARFDAA
jgi:hypothetical protein